VIVHNLLLLGRRLHLHLLFTGVGITVVGSIVVVITVFSTLHCCCNSGDGCLGQCDLLFATGAFVTVAVAVAVSSPASGVVGFTFRDEASFLFRR
jgi:hypothetical protein